MNRRVGFLDWLKDVGTVVLAIEILISTFFLTALLPTSIVFGVFNSASFFRELGAVLILGIGFGVFLKMTRDIGELYGYI